ncbi:MAG: efflux RND transporter periplasmic adaptor subunit [Beijerinckiaceae bacterium]|nr:efflux RND transporter periplasmic adaptor subunit [Beijerinckiaceae bacterium]
MRRPALCLAALLPLAAMPAAGAAEIEVRAVPVIESKAVFGRIESRFVIPARARIGGTVAELTVTEGSPVAAGQVVARVVDEKLRLQVDAVDARIRAARAELANARAEYERVQSLMGRGATTQQRVDQARTQVDVLVSQVAQADAERALVLQQASEGDVLAPSAGRVLGVMARRGAVVMQGEAVATVAAGGLFLRLAIPERHAAMLSVGAKVEIGGRGAARIDDAREGRIEKVYPQIEAGRVIADVAVENLPDGFVGERVLVRVPVAERGALTVPPGAIRTRAGLDIVTISDQGKQRDIIVVTGEMVATPDGRHREVLTGLRAGDRVIIP